MFGYRAISLVGSLLAYPSSMSASEPACRLHRPPPRKRTVFLFLFALFNCYNFFFFLRIGARFTLRSSSFFESLRGVLPPSPRSSSPFFGSLEGVLPSAPPCARVERFVVDHSEVDRLVVEVSCSHLASRHRLCLATLQQLRLQNLHQPRRLDRVTKICEHFEKLNSNLLNVWNFFL